AVVLPEPLSPTNPSVRPDRSENETLRTACNTDRWPNRDLRGMAKRTDSPRTSSSAFVVTPPPFPLRNMPPCEHRLSISGFLHGSDRTREDSGPRRRSPGQA